MNTQKISNRQIRDYIALRKRQQLRNLSHQIMITDKKTCFEIKSYIKQLIVNKEFKGDLPSHYEKILATDDDLKKISGMKNNPQFVAIAQKPNLTLKKDARRIVFLDHLQDPGNIGGIIRSALAFNFDALYFCPNCCDPFNDKALRAAKSAIFHLPIFKIETTDFVEKFKSFTFFQADLSGQSLGSTAVPEKSILIFSNEGSGPTNNLACQKTSITIPISSKVESLNVAAAANILMYHFNTQTLQGCSS